MKYLWILLLIGCAQEYTFEVFTNNKYVENVVIKDEDGVIEMGELPFIITSEEDMKLTAEFEANVSNFGSNYLQCNCVETSFNHWECAENFIVDGKDWEIAK